MTDRSQERCRRKEKWMNVIRTAMLIALLTALFMGVGY